MSDGDRQSEETLFVADNVDEFVQRTRWNQILEARHESQTALRRAAQLEAEFRATSSDDAERLAAKSIRDTVESYVLECERLFTHTDVGKELWTSAEIATIPTRKLFTPELEEGGLEEFQGLDWVEPVGDTELTFRQGKVRVQGMREFLDFGDARVRYQGTVSIRCNNPDAKETRTATASLTTPVELSREAYRTTNALVDHIGPGFDVVDDADSAVDGDYSDLLDDLDS
jgi:hypothetical protein